MFYYFITGSSDVFEREASVDASVYPQFIPLTEGEVAVHLQYPDYDRYRIDQKIRTDNPYPSQAGSGMA